MQIDERTLRYPSIAAAAQTIQAAGKSKPGGEANKPFGEILKSAVSRREAPTFSRHAGARMSQRDIALSGEELDRLSDAVGKAEDKGVKNTLVLMGQRAFIVNVPDNVVVTAMNGQDLRENVFTQIDGAVIV